MTVARRLVALALASALTPAALALDAQRRAEAKAMAHKAAAWLSAKQDTAAGGWAVNPDPKANQFPAITGLIVTGMLTTGERTASDADIARATEFMLTFRKPDGGIYDKGLPSYNTSICVSTLARVGTPDAKAAALAGADFLKALQWSEDAGSVRSGDSLRRLLGQETPEAPTPVARDHPFYGGVGYGRNQRPDLSNLQMALEAWHDAGVDTGDPAYQRALVFLARVQMLEKLPDGSTHNDMGYATGSRQGGFIYATSKDGKTPGGGQTQVAAESSMVEESLDDGTKVSRLRCYGSMTYSGFKSLLYAGLKKDDPRVLAAYDWLRAHYTLEENPAMGNSGLYYYFVVMSRALAAWGEPTINVIPSTEPGAPRVVEPRDWGNDLVVRLKTLQNEDGSFKSLDERWMENNTELITAYALIALGEAMGSK